MPPVSTRKAFTDSYLRSIKPKADSYHESDPAQPGLYIRVSPKGRITFRARYSIDGAKRWLDLGVYNQDDPSRGMRLAEARALADKHRSAARNGSDPVAERRAAQAAREAERAAQEAEEAKRKTVDQLIEEFVEKRIKGKRKPSSAPGILRQLRFDVSPVLGTRDIRTIKKRDIADLIDGMNDRRRALDLPEVKGTQRHIVQLLKQMFTYAVERDYLELSPADAIITENLIPRLKPRERILSDDEIRAIWNGTLRVFPYVRASLKVLLLTAQRRGSLIASRWEHIDFDKRLWTIPRENMKGGKRTHKVHLSDGALAAFKELQQLAGPSEWVLPGVSIENHVTERVITRLVAEALTPPPKDPEPGQPQETPKRVDPWTPHDLRRTASTRMNELGADYRVVENILDHALQGSEKHYNHSKLLAQRKEALDLLWTHIHAIVSKEV